MTRENLAYAAYAIGSVIFVLLALRRESVLLAVGSALFLLGTLLFVVPRLTPRRRGRDET